MTWLWAVTSVWLALGALLGVLIGRGIRLADRKEAERLAAAALRPNFVVDEAVHQACAQALISEQTSVSATESIPSPRTAPRG